MRRIIAFLLIFVSCLSCGCKKENPYLKHVSELRQDVYVGTYGDLTVTAYYGFCEYPFISDGKTGEPVYGYNLKLNVIADDVKRTAEIICDGVALYSEFKYDDVTGEYKARVETNVRFPREFTLNLVIGNDKTPVTMKSIVPENCITHETALDVLSEKQKSLLDSYASDGNFNAEIYMRISVKNEKPYWYIGIVSEKGKLKAFLIDGFSGEILAIRDIF